MTQESSQEPQLPIIHHYDAHTGFFINTSIGQLDPLDKTPLVPRYSTLVPAPQVMGGDKAFWNGAGWEIIPYQEPSIDMEAIIKQAIPFIDSQAENCRLQFITPGAAQSMVYQRKVQEAETLMLDQFPDQENYPLLTAEIDITSTTLQEIGESVLAQRDAWLYVAAQIERTRLLAKGEVRNATTKEQIDTIIAGLEWPQPEES